MYLTDIKVKVKEEFNHIKDVFPLGFETEIYIVVTDEDEHKPAVMVYSKEEGKDVVWLEAHTVPKGTYVGMVFKGINGEEYGDKWLSSVHNKSVSDLFEKIDNN